MRVVVVGAGVGGLAAATRLAAAGHAVTVFEAAGAPGGKCARVTLGTHGFDAGPSLLTMPHVVQGLLTDVGADPLELLEVEPVTRYRFADATAVDLGRDGAATEAALEAWSPGAGRDWAAVAGLRAAMWAAGEPFLTGPPPWPPRRPGPGERPPDPRDGLRVRPWATLAGVVGRRVRDPRLRDVLWRFATYAGSDPRRAPAALLLAGHVEHAFGAWLPRGGLHAIVERLWDRLRALDGTLHLDTPVAGLLREGRHVRGVRLADGREVAADVVVFNGDAAALTRRRSRTATAPGAAPALPAWQRPGATARAAGAAALARRRPERSLSGLAVLLALRGRTPGAAHHEIAFPADYAAELDDLFVHRRPVRDPTVYCCRPHVTDPDSAPAGEESLFVLVNAPAGVQADWEAEADRVVARLGLGDRVLARAVRGPDVLARDTRAVDGAIYGAATHGRLGSLRRPGVTVPGVRGLLRVGGTVHPGGGLPLVMLGAALVAREVGPA